MKKIMALSLAAVMTVSVFSGCGKKETITSALFNPDLKLEDTGGLELPLADGTEEITWSVDCSETDLNDSYVAKKIREATGVNLNLLAFPESVAAEKIKVLIASKDLPDIVGQGLDPSYANDLAVQGAFAAVEDYLDIVPNFRRIFVETKENNWIFKTHAAADGKLYGFFGWDYNRPVNTGCVLYRKDIFDKHGLTMWNSPEEFYETLKKLKELYPDSYPYTIKSGDGIFKSWSRSWNGMNGQDMFYDEKDGKWYFTDVQPAYKEMLDLMLKCYNEGLIDPEFLTNTQAAWTTKMTQRDKAFVTTDWLGRLDMFKEQTKDSVPEYDLRFANPIGPTGRMPETSQLCWARHVAASGDVETSFKLLDFILSPAGKALITMGIEGETYVIGEDGMAQYLEFEGKKPSMTELIEKYGMFVQGMYLSFDRRSTQFNYTEREQEAQDFALDPDNIEPMDPQLVFTPEENERRNAIINEFVTKGREFATKYILNNGGEKEWNEWLETAKEIGAEEIEKIYNDAQKRYNEM